MITKLAANRIRVDNEAQLVTLSSQVEQLILSGQPGPAIQVIGRMKAIDAEYPQITPLEEQALQLLALEDMYKDVLQLEDSGDYPGALALLRQIENAQPGLWDVQNRLVSVQNNIDITTYFEQGAAAYAADDWSGVIESYEAALKIDPKLDDPLMKEQLLNGYLHAIIEMLENDVSTIEDIQTAEDYYRKAISMIPQSKSFAGERESLQKVSVSLLELKYSQLAKAMLEDPHQTANSVRNAVNYLAKAVNLNPENSQNQFDYTNAQLYQIGFQNFVEMNWNLAIDNLIRLTALDRDYANGNARILLYEAYIARGNQYYSVGLYIDARSNFEQAEILAWEEPENPIRVFQSRYLLGNALGRLDDFKGAVEYYQYALNQINVFPKLTAGDRFSELVYSATGLAAEGKNEEAYAQYNEAFSNILSYYKAQTIEINDGECLAFFARENHSTILAIQSANQLSNNVTVTFGQELSVPVLP